MPGSNENLPPAGQSTATKKNGAAPSNPTGRGPTAAKTTTPTTPGLKGTNKNLTKQVLQEKNTKLEDENSRLKGTENFLTMGIANNKQIFGAAKILQLEEVEHAAKLAVAEAKAARKVAEEKIKNSRVDPMHEIIQKPTTAEMKDSGSRGRLLKAMKLENNKAEYLAIQARRNHPHLEKFQNNWATVELVKQFLQNKRKANKKRKVGTTVGARNNKRSRFNDSDNSDGEVGEGSGSGEREIADDDDEDLGA
ncbi:hypothetical protein DFJ58DRAFT_726260 [Suillus subalutaceus]|uniref:uncharacterized protein n=1 Tax=Suillus subalutaceus TaxID=48586 RepID=UPI001B87B4D9|nr:uncharacterized protein DFJ58DRAFT_726260 [Suillus subalutaceus]KAG1859538.1 hypothetical protein DFJ58DRAFT_726260 [Suillus subalutaceus]